MRRNNKSKDADKGKDKDETLDTSDLLIESRHIGTDPVSVSDTVVCRSTT